MNWKRLLALAHNCLGFALSLLFVLWFASGIVMIYRDYPRWKLPERLSHLESVKKSSLRVAPSEALARAGLGTPVKKFRVEMFAGRPLYRIKPEGKPWRAVYADDGSRFHFDRVRETRHLRSMGFGSVRSWSRLEYADQWTLTGFEFDDHAPLYMARVGPGGDHLVYVSSRTGEVLQSVSFPDRVWGYLGAVTHWIYPTVLRRRVELWVDVVVWTSLLGTLVCLLGIVAGLVFFRWDQFGRWLLSFVPGREDRPSKPIVPYRDWLGWHTYLGFAFGLFACTWIFSGLLSMSPWGWHTHAPSRRAEAPYATTLKGPMESLKRHPGEAVSRCDRKLTPKMVRLLSVGDKKYYYCLETTSRTRLVPAGGSAKSFERFAPDRLIGGFRESLEYPVKEAKVMDSYDNYYYPGRPVRFGSPKPRRPYLRIKVEDPAESWFYVDLHTGQLARTVRYRDRWNRWLYHGLHNLDFPFLYRGNPGLWYWTMWILLVGGLGISFTGLWLTVRWVGTLGSG